jgi:hypothetical protein
LWYWFLTGVFADCEKSATVLITDGWLRSEHRRSLPVIMLNFSQAELIPACRPYLNISSAFCEKGTSDSHRVGVTRNDIITTFDYSEITSM